MIGLAAVFRSFAGTVRQLWRDPRSRGLVVLVAGLIGGGTVFYQRVEGFGWIESLYFTVITLTTVGYGDLAPSTTAGRLFTVFFVLIGVGLLVAFVSEVARTMIDRRAGDES